MFTKLFMLIFIVGLFSGQIFAQEMFHQSRIIQFEERNLSGPRLGVTLVPGNGELVKTLGGEEKAAEMIRMGGSSGFNAHLSGGSDFKGDYLNLDKS